MTYVWPPAIDVIDTPRHHCANIKQQTNNNVFTKEDKILVTVSVLEKGHGAKKFDKKFPNRKRPLSSLARCSFSCSLHFVHIKT